MRQVLPRRRLERAKSIDPFPYDVSGLIPSTEKKFKAKADREAADAALRQQEAEEFRQRVERYLEPRADDLPQPALRPWHIADSSGLESPTQRADAIRSQLKKEQFQREYDKTLRRRKLANGIQMQDLTKSSPILPSMQHEKPPPLSSQTSKRSWSRQRLQNARERDIKLQFGNPGLALSPSSRSLSPSPSRSTSVSSFMQGGNSISTTARGKPLFVRAMHPISSTIEEFDLLFERGDIIRVIRESEDGWNYGENLATGQKGNYPITFVSPCESPRKEAAREEAALRAGEIAAVLAEAFVELPQDQNFDSKTTQNIRRGGSTSKASLDTDEVVANCRTSKSLSQIPLHQSRHQFHQNKQSIHHAPATNTQQTCAALGEQYEEEECAATRLQALRRGIVARRQLNDLQDKEQSLLRLENEANESNINGSALKVQAIYRGHKARKDYYVVQQINVEAATTIQATFRGQHARKMNALHQKSYTEAQAAAKLQAIQRGRIVRQKVKSGQNDKQIHRQGNADRSKDESKALIALQAQVRGQLARKHAHESFEDKHEAHAIAHDSGRNHFENIIFTDQTENSARTEVNSFSKVDGIDTTEAAVLLQAKFRGHLARKKYPGVREEENKAATKLQAVYRGHLARNNALSNCVSGLGEEATRTWDYWNSLEAAKLLQANIRGYLSRKKYHEGPNEMFNDIPFDATSSEAATLLQATFRGQLARKHLAQKQQEEMPDSTRHHAGRRGQVARNQLKSMGGYSQELTNQEGNYNKFTQQIEQPPHRSIERRPTEVWYDEIQEDKDAEEAALEAAWAYVEQDTESKEESQRRSVVRRQTELWDDDLEDELELLDPTVLKRFPATALSSPRSAHSSRSSNSDLISTVSSLPDIPYVDYYVPDEGK